MYMYILSPNPIPEPHKGHWDSGERRHQSPGGWKQSYGLNMGVQKHQLLPQQTGLTMLHLPP